MLCLREYSNADGVWKAGYEVNGVIYVFKFISLCF